MCVLPLKLPPCSKTFQEAQTDLNHTAAELNHSAGEVVHSSRGTSSQLAAASGKFSQDFDEFLDAGIEMAGHTQVGFMIIRPLHTPLKQFNGNPPPPAFYTWRGGFQPLMDKCKSLKC